MKFQNSAFEERYNLLWNKEVVKSFKLITEHIQFGAKQKFFASGGSLDSLVEKYCNGIKTTVNNFIRQMDDFEDKEYTANYLNEIKEQALEDLQRFEDKISRRFTDFTSMHALILQTKDLLTRDSSSTRSLDDPMNLTEDKDFILTSNAMDEDLVSLGKDDDKSLDLEDPQWCFSK